MVLIISEDFLISCWVFYSVLVWIEPLWKSPSVIWWIHVEDFISVAGRKCSDQGAVEESEPNRHNTCQPWRNSRQIHHKVCCDILVHNRRRHPASLGHHLRNSFHSSGWETSSESCQPTGITGRLASSNYWKSISHPIYFEPTPIIHYVARQHGNKFKGAKLSLKITVTACVVVDYRWR